MHLNVNTVISIANLLRGFHT